MKKGKAGERKKGKKFNKIFILILSAVLLFGLLLLVNYSFTGRVISIRTDKASIEKESVDSFDVQDSPQVEDVKVPETQPTMDTQEVPESVVDVGDSCYDSDGMNNFLESGYIIFNSEKFYDYCEGNVAYDYFCGITRIEKSSNFVANVIRSIGNVISEEDTQANSQNCLTYGGDFVCENGKCVEKKPVNDTPKMHSVCSNEKCVYVEGEGVDECVSDSECVVTIPTHKICSNQNCISVEGEGVDECVSDSECVITINETPKINQTTPEINETSQKHRICSNEKCIEVEGGGADECTSNSQCVVQLETHKACYNQACVTVQGEGVDECSMNSQCIQENIVSQGETGQDQTTGDDTQKTPKTETKRNLIVTIFDFFTGIFSTKKDQGVCEGDSCWVGSNEFEVDVYAPTTEEIESTFLASSDPPGVTDYYGEVKIDGVAAPAGTKVLAITSQDIVCGEFEVTTSQPGIGWYGFLHCSCGGIDPTCDGEKINFAIQEKGQEYRYQAVISGDTTWDQSVKRVDLRVVTTCSDGTKFGRCVYGNVPYYCKQTSATTGEIIRSCQNCGCPPSIRNPDDPLHKFSNYYCCGDGRCELEPPIVNGIPQCTPERKESPGGTT